MIDLKFIDEISRKLGNALPPGVSQLREEIESRFSSILQQALQNANFVTRDEFEEQKAVLAETRKRIEALLNRIQEKGTG